MFTFRIKKQLLLAVIKVFEGQSTTTCRRLCLLLARGLEREAARVASGRGYYSRQLGHPRPPFGAAACHRAQGISSYSS